MKLLDRFRKKPYRSLDRLAPDELSAFSVVAYFECSAEDIRAACKQLGNDCTFVAEPSPRMLLSCPQPTWTATLWEGGKALVHECTLIRGCNSLCAVAAQRRASPGWLRG